jgi:hypothetical protein
VARAVPLQCGSISMPDVCETPDNVGKYDEGERKYAENDTYHRIFFFCIHSVLLRVMYSMQDNTS